MRGLVGTLLLFVFASGSLTAEAVSTKGIKCHDTGHFGSLNLDILPVAGNLEINLHGWGIQEVVDDLGSHITQAYSVNFATPIEHCVFSDAAFAVLYCISSGDQFAVVSDFDGKQLGTIGLRFATVNLSQIKKLGYFRNGEESERQGLQMEFSLLQKDSDLRAKRTQDYLYGGECQEITD